MRTYVHTYINALNQTTLTGGVITYVVIKIATIRGVEFTKMHTFLAT
jgi:hypothetical protein